MKTILPLAALLLLPILPEAWAQRSVTYQELLQQADRPGLYSTMTILPSGTGEPLLMASFRIDYDLLPFRREQPGPGTAEDETGYFSAASIHMEVFRDNNSVSRHSWADTARASTFEQTRSRSEHLEGAIVSRLPSGEYRLQLELNRSDSPAPRTLAPRSRRDRERPDRAERSVTIPDFDSSGEGSVLLLDSWTETEGTIELRLLNYGNGVLYGQDYRALIFLPATPESGSMDLRVEALRTGSESETTGDPLHATTISADELLHTDGFETSEERGPPRLRFRTSEEGWAVLLVEIPGRRFPNVRHLITLEDSESGTLLARSAVQSRWIDIPVSLLNLDIAIDMLRFILSDSDLRSFRRGSRSEREERFRRFWQERDQTPDTEYNELMVEYYRRIDQAYEQFTTPEQPGYDSDQGRAWILYGPPRQRERRFPAGSPTREIWVYPGRTLVFEATTGFGDFRLIREE